MNVWEGVGLALNQIRTEKLKSFFSLLGVIIGVMFLLVVVSVVEGMDRYITEDFASQIFGINTITVVNDNHSGNQSMRGFDRAHAPTWSHVFERVEFLRLVSVNRDIMIRSFALLAGFSLFTRTGAQFGAVTLAANAILMNFFMIAGYYLDGFATAAEQQRAASWIEHQDINEVMLATSLAPDGFLVLLPPYE